MSKRRYRQYCGMARALDVVGERWTLLIARELILGPRRYKDLLHGLPGIGTNLLAARLKELEANGVVARRELPPPAGSAVYELTEIGEGLEPVIMELSRWGQHLLAAPMPGDRVRLRWYVGGMRARFRRAEAGDADEKYEFRAGGEVVHAHVHDGTVEAGEGPAVDPDLVIRARTPADFIAFVSGERPLHESAKSGAIEVEGDREVLERCARVFGMA